MEEHDYHMLLPRAVGMAVRLRKKLDTFHPQRYDDNGVQRIGYGYRLSHGISEPVATILIKTRFNEMGQALMRKAFESNVAGDPARFGVFVDIAERVGDGPVLQEQKMWDAIKQKDYWKLHEAFLTSPLIEAYGKGTEGRERVSYLAHVLVEGESAV